MRQSTLLVVNTLATFSRMLLTVGMGLVATRLFLQALGAVDYGLLSVLGAAGSLLGLMTVALKASAQRHLAYDIGRGDREVLAGTFSTSFAMFFALALALVSIGEAISPLVLRGLTIPVGRETAAWWVYQASLLTLASTIALTPFRGMISAHQDILITTIFDAVNSVARLGIAVTLFFLPWDRLIALAWLNCLLVLLICLGIAAVCMRRYPESVPRTKRVKIAEMRRIGDYAGWSFLGTVAYSMRQNGASIIINVGFGPAVNAAFAIALQLCGYAGNLGRAILNAVRPAIVSLEAKGNRAAVHRLALVTGKYICLLLTMAIVPLWLEIPDLLKLWLKDVPDHTIVLSRISLLWMMIVQFGAGFIAALQAKGDIGWYNRLVLTFALGSLAIVIVAVFVFGLGPWSVPAATAITMIAMTAVTVKLIGRKIGLRSRALLRRTIWPIVIVTVPATVAAVGLQQLMLPGILRVFVVVAAYNGVAIPLIWIAALETWEREQFKRIGASVFRSTRWPRRSRGSETQSPPKTDS